VVEETDANGVSLQTDNTVQPSREVKPHKVFAGTALFDCFCSWYVWKTFLQLKISLSSIVAKTYNRMILNCIRPEIDKKLRINQNGFWLGRTTTSQILALRRIIEGVKEHQLPAIITFIDFRKAFDSICFFFASLLLDIAVLLRYEAAQIPSHRWKYDAQESAY